MDEQSVLSDGLLKDLIAVGQVDILVGLPTLDNAATVGPVVRAVQVCFAREFARQRTVLINSDGGSTDGTPDVIRGAGLSEGDALLTSHPLRTVHRVVAPYHGMPGKHTALKTVFAAAELTQAKVVVVIDPAGPTTEAERLAELTWPVLRDGVAFLSPRHRRHPREGLLVTQLARPLVRALFGVELDEPLGLEFACSGRFASHCLEQEIWQREVARYAIDLWLRTEAVASGHPVGQVWRPPGAPPGARASLRDAVQQVMLALLACVTAQQDYWLGLEGVRPLQTWGQEAGPLPDPPEWDHLALARQAQQDLRDLWPLVSELLEEGPLAALAADLQAPVPTLDDDLWVALVYAVLAASRRKTTGAEHLAGLFVPLYLWRAAAFLARTAEQPAEAVEAALQALGATFERLKPQLVGRWTADV